MVEGSGGSNKGQQGSWGRKPRKLRGPGSRARPPHTPFLTFPTPFLPPSLRPPSFHPSLPP